METDISKVVDDIARAVALHMNPLVLVPMKANRPRLRTMHRICGGNWGEVENYAPGVPQMIADLRDVIAEHLPESDGPQHRDLPATGTTTSEDTTNN